MKIWMDGCMFYYIFPEQLTGNSLSKLLFFIKVNSDLEEKRT